MIYTLPDDSSIAKPIGTVDQKLYFLPRLPNQDNLDENRREGEMHLSEESHDTYKY